MDRLDLHEILCSGGNAARGEIVAPCQHGIEPAQECRKPAAAVFLKGMRIGGQGAEICLFLCAACGHLHQAEKIGAAEDAADQLLRRIHCRAELHLIQKAQQRKHLVCGDMLRQRLTCFDCFADLQHRLIEPEMLPVKPDGDQLIDREAEQRREHRSRCGNFRQRIVDQTQDIEQQQHFRRFQIILLFDAANGDACGRDRVGDLLHMRSGAHQDQKITRLTGARAAVLIRHGRTLFEMRADALRDDGRFIGIGIRCLRNENDLGRPPSLRIFRTAHECLRCVICDLADALRHQHPEDVVDDIDDLLPAAEIAVEQDAGVLGELRGMIGRTLAHGAVKVFGIGIAEAVDALLAVADDEQIVAVMLCIAAVREHPEDEILLIVRILKFVDHDAAVLL